jgi:hypothetical protein
MTNFYKPSEVSALAENLAHQYRLDSTAEQSKLIDPELIASKYFGLDIFPQRNLQTAGVRSGIDTTQSVIFIDYDTYMDEDKQPYSRQGIAHELGHVIFDPTLIRQISSVTVSDAYERHSILVSANQGIESRANMLAGGLLVPRGEFRRDVAKMIHVNAEKVLELLPDLTLGQVFKQLASSQLAKRYCVTDYVIGWRFDQEELHLDFRATPDTPLADLDMRLVAKIAGSKYTPQPLTERMLALLPAELRSQVAAA